MEQKQILMEMYGDIKTLVSEVKAINGDLRETKTQFNEHKKESVSYRKKIDELWAGVHFAKWIIMLIFGTGLLFNLIGWIIK